MAEVGVLELQIRDNAAEAGSGLDQLAGALGRVKNAIPGNKSSLGLSKVGTELNSLARQINGAKSGTATIIKNVTALFNSISGLGKLKRIDLDTTPIDKIKNAIGDGLNLGNTGTQLKNLRDAFSKPWDASGAVAAMGSIVEVANTLKQEDTVGKISAVATALSNYSSAITKYTKAYKDLPKSNDKMEAIIQNLAFGISKGQIEEQQQLYEEATAQARENWEKSGRHGIPLDLQFHAGKGKETTSAGQIMMDLDRLLGPAVEETTNLQDAFVKVDKSVGGANIQLVEFKDTITSIDTTGMDRLSKTFDSLERKSGAVRSIADMTKEVDEAMEYMDIKGVNFEAYNKAIDSIFEYLEGKIKYTGRNGIQRFIDAQMGIGNKSTKGENYYKNIFPVDMLEEAAKPLTDGSMEKAAQDTVSVAGNLAEKASEISDDIKAIIPYNENIENSWENIARGISEAARRAKEEYARACEEAIAYNKRLNEEIKNKYRSYGQTIESIYSGNGSFSAGLRGELGPKTQEWAIDDVAKKFGMTADEVRAKIEQMKAAAEAATQSMDDMKTSIISMQGMQGFDTFAKFAEMFAMWNKMRMGMSLGDGGGIPKLGPGFVEGEGSVSAPIEDAKNAIDEAGQSSTNATGRLKDLDRELKNKKKDAKGAASGFRDFKKSIENLFPSLTNIVKSFKRIALSRFIRSVIRTVTDGFKTGVENVYNYSKAIGSSFAPSMDSAASSLLQMKNSVGAAVAPLIQSLVPVLQTVVNWFITAVNYVNQFFALLRGQATWTRALPATTTAFGKQEKAAKGAAAAIKDLLADWDELNIIQSETSGSGSGAGTSATEDYLNMFEEVSTFDNKVKSVVDYIRDNFETIKNVALLIGEALLLWKVSEAVAAVFHLVNTLQGGVIMAAIGFTLLGLGGHDVGKNGINIGNALESIGGLVATTLGGAWIGAAAATALGATAATGSLIGGVTGLGIGLWFLAREIYLGAADSGYGNLSEDVATIRKNIEENYLTTDAKMSIEVTQARIKDTQAAEKKVADAVKELQETYPLSIKLKSKEDAEDLLAIVNNIVAATNELADDRKEKIRIPVTTSGQFANPDEVISFTDSEWDDIKEYVTGLGDDIGKMIADGITEGADLDDLKEKLIRMANAVTYGLKSGEFAGNIGLAGSTSRENLSNGLFDRGTVENYIKEYKKFSEEKMQEAKAAAVAEQAQFGALLASSYEQYQQTGDAKDYEDYLKAKDLYETFNVSKRATQLFEQWTADGTELFVNDILDALGFAMKNNANLLGKRGNLESQLEQITRTGTLANVNDSIVDQYIENIKTGLIMAISAETGFGEDFIRQLLGDYNINAMDLFDDEYAKKIQSQMLSALERSKLTDEQKRKVMSAFGFDFDEWTEEEKEVIKQLVAEAKENGSNVVTVPEEYTGDKKTTVPDAIAEYYGNVEIPSFFSVEDIDLSELPGYDGKKLHVAGTIDIGMSDGAQSIMQYVLNAVQSGKGIDEITAAVQQGILSEGPDAFAEVAGMINEIVSSYREMEKNGFVDTEAIMRKYGQYGTAGVPSGEQVHLDEGDLSSGVQAGTERANAEQNTILRDIERVLRLINNKPNTVVYAPNTTAARVNKQSDVMFANVTGDV